MNFKAVIIHFLYRFLRLAFTSVQNVYDVIRKRNCRLLQKNTAEVCTILYRRKMHPSDMATSNDFVWVHNHFIDGCSLIRDRRWSLYTIDEKFAYFLQTPDPFTDYTINVAPFFYIKQFQEATKLCKCTLDNFLALTQGLDDRKGPVIYVSSAARSGSTLMGQLLQAAHEKVRVFGEPDAFTVLTYLKDRNKISEDKVYLLVKAIFKQLVRFQEPEEVYITKVRSNSIRLTPYIKTVCPNVKHFFTFRKNTKALLKSAEKMCRLLCSEEYIWLWNRINPEFACWLTAFCGFEYELTKRFGMNDSLDNAILIHISSYWEYMKYKNLLDLPWILYEDVITNPRDTLKAIFTLCHIPMNCIDNSLKVLHKDSQAGTIMNRESIKLAEASELTKEKIDKIKKICRALNVPELENLI